MVCTIYQAFKYCLHDIPCRAAGLKYYYFILEDKFSHKLCDHLFICLYHNLWKVGPIYNYPYPTNGMGKGSIEKARRYSDCFGSDGNGPDICSSNCT